MAQVGSYQAGIRNKGLCRPHIDVLPLYKPICVLRHLEKPYLTPKPTNHLYEPHNVPYKPYHNPWMIFSLSKSTYYPQKPLL